MAMSPSRDYDQAGRRTSCDTLDSQGGIIRDIETAYVDGSMLVAWRRVDDMVTWFTYDYRGREASRTVFPQVDPTQATFDPAIAGALTTTTTYKKNRVDVRTDAYGRRTFFLYNIEDMVDRVVHETLPGAIASGTNLRSLTRDLSSNASYIITDRRYDHQTHDLLQATDGRGIIDTYTYDIRSRLDQADSLRPRSSQPAVTAVRVLSAIKPSLAALSMITTCRAT